MATAVGRFSTRPLYLQVKDTLVQRIVAGDWKPGAAIPNEIELSRELGISVGTVRKALDEMESERLISRRQGRGTFVIDQSSEECATRFSNMRSSDGVRIAGEVHSSEIVSAAASETEARLLQLRPSEPVYRLIRVRTHDGNPFMLEESTIPQARFPGLEQETDISPSIVVLAHRYGVLLARAEERISVTAAEDRDAGVLNVVRGAPLLKLDSVVFAIDGRPVEWRVARCHMRDSFYMTEIN
jgi:GntR family transcriptional regulator